MAPITPRSALQAAAVVVATLAAAAPSFGITITPLAVSPIFLVIPVGVALLARLGAWAWPWMLAGDVIGEALVTSRPAPYIAFIALVHVALALLGAQWVTRGGAWPGDLRSSVRYLGGAVVISVCAGLALGLAEHLQPGVAGVGVRELRWSVLWATVGVVVGFVVTGPPLMILLERGRPIARPANWVIVTIPVLLVVAGMGLLGDWHTAVPVAVLGVMLVVARAGRLWGGLTLMAIAAMTLIGANHGKAPFGGQGTQAALGDAMVALAFVGGLALLLGGYRRSGAATRIAPARAALLFAAMMLAAGIAGVMANEVVVNEDQPLAVAGLFTLVSAVGLVIIRFARPPAARPARNAVAWAAVAGALYALNLALLFHAIPLIGSGSATTLAMVTPLPVVILSLVVLRLVPSAAVMAAVGVIVLGAVIAVSGAAGDAGGVVLAVGSSVAFAASVIATRRALAGASVIDVAMASVIVAAIVALGTSVVTEGPSALLLSDSQVRELAVAALGAQLIPILGRTWALEWIGADVVGAEGVLAPSSTALLSFWLIGPAGTTPELIGLAIIAIGAVMAALAGGRWPARPLGTSRRGGEGVPSRQSSGAPQRLRAHRSV